MKIIRYRQNGTECYGAFKGDKVLDLQVYATHFNLQLPSTLDDFISAGDETWKTAETVYAKAVDHSVPHASQLLSSVTTLAPIANPPKIIGLGWNYIDHVSETKQHTPKEPVIFMKPHTSIIGPKEKIIKPSFVKELDYEAELAIVIGKKAKNLLSAEQAGDFIFGYTILNDVSARDFQFKDGQWTKGKGFDTFAPTGPAITICSQLPDTTNLRIRTWINNELRQDGTTKDMVFNVKQIVYHLSRFMTLEPCDVIATGTPSGVAMAMKKPKWLEVGDVVRMEIEGIGILENTVSE